MIEETFRTETSQYRIGAFIEKGAFARVYRATRELDDGLEDQTSDGTFAVKVVSRDFGKKAAPFDCLDEVEVMQRFSHENVIRLEDSWCSED